MQFWPLTQTLTQYIALISLYILTIDCFIKKTANVDNLFRKTQEYVMRILVYRFMLHSEQLAPPPPTQIPRGILPPHPGQLAAMGWSYPGLANPQKTGQNLMQKDFIFVLNKKFFYRNMGKLIFMCICIFYLIRGNWGPEYYGLTSLHLCQKTWQTPFQKTIYHLIDFPIKQSFEYYIDH